MSDLSVGIPLPCSPSVQALAQRGLADMSKAYDESGQRTVGDQYLGQVLEDPAATDLERVVAGTARTAANHRLASSSAVGSQQVSLRALAAGVGGPVGVLIGTLGQKTLAQGYDQEDQRTMARDFLDALAQHGTSLEHQVAQAATAASSQRLAHSSALGVQTAALQMAARGLQGSPEEALAHLGKKALASAYDQEDQRLLGNVVLDSIQATGGDAVLDTLARAAGTACSQRLAQSTAVGVQEAAMDLVMSPPSGDMDTLLATLGKKGIARAYDQEDARAVSASLLERISEHGTDPIHVAVAQVTRAATGQRLSHSSAVGTNEKAFSQILAGTTGENLEVVLSRLGLAARSCAYDTEDARAMLGVIIQEIGQRTGDAKVQAMVTYAQTYAGRGVSVADSDAVQIQRDILDSIVKGNLTVPAPPASATQSTHSASLSGAASTAQVMQPVVDENASPEAAREALETSVAHNKQVVVEMDALAKTLAADLPARQAQQQVLADRLNTMSEAETPLVKRLQVASRAMVPTGLVGLGGVFASMATHSPVALGVAITAGIGYAVSALVRTHATNKRQDLLHEYQSTKFTYDMGQFQVASLQGEIESAHTVAEQAEKAIKDAQGRLDVHRMAEALNAAPPDANARVTVEEEAVVIGGVRILKKTAAQVEEA